MGYGERGTTPVIVSMSRYCTTLLIELLQPIIVYFNLSLSTSSHYCQIQLIIVNFNLLLSTSSHYWLLQLIIVNFISLLSASTNHCQIQLIIDYFNSLLSTSCLLTVYFNLLLSTYCLLIVISIFTYDRQGSYLSNQFTADTMNAV